MKKIIQKQLGEILIDNKMITTENLDKALKLQSSKGGLIGQILIEMGCITEEAIAKTLTVQYGFPYLPLGGYEIEVEVAKLIPENVARKFELVAVDRVGAILTIAMSNPLNSQAIEEIEKLTHHKVQVFISTSTDIKDAIKRCYVATA